jgi:hypothetical protein
MSGRSSEISGDLFDAAQQELAEAVRPRFALIRWLSGQCRFNVNQRFAADLMDRY